MVRLVHDCEAVALRPSPGADHQALSPGLPLDADVPRSALEGGDEHVDAVGDALRRRPRRDDEPLDDEERERAVLRDEEDARGGLLLEDLERALDRHERLPAARGREEQRDSRGAHVAELLSLVPRQLGEPHHALGVAFEEGAAVAAERYDVPGDERSLNLRLLRVAVELSAVDEVLLLVAEPLQLLVRRRPPARRHRDRRSLE